MTRGLPAIRRVNARNYTQEEANLRLKEVIAPYQRQGLNALGVDSYEVLLFLKKPSSQACTCKEVQMTSDLGDALEPVKGRAADLHEINIDWKRPLFGEHSEKVEEVDGTELDDYGFDDSPVQHANQIFESSPDCGICYRTGFVPGFVQYGKHRTVLTTHHVVDQRGATINRTLAPHVFERLTLDGWVEFELAVPKYFNTVRFSVRNNLDVVDATLVMQTLPLTSAMLRASAGKTIRIQVSAEEFTHVVFVFDLGTDVVRANIAQMSKSTDWTMFNTIGNLNVILPMTIPELSTGSFILVPKTGAALVVTDITYLRPEDGRNLDWSVNTRVCQPQEAALRIANSLPLV